MTDVTFQVTTYWKRPRGEPGLTQLRSVRLDITQALNWILAEVPDYALNVREPTADTVIIEVDWALVPDGVQRPRITRGRR